MKSRWYSAKSPPGIQAYKGQSQRQRKPAHHGRLGDDVLHARGFDEVWQNHHAQANQNAQNAFDSQLVVGFCVEFGDWFFGRSWR